MLQLDGTTDWRLAARKALLAWTGSTLSITPSLATDLPLAHWGSTIVTGRGLLALAGQGQIFYLSLPPGESYIAHPSNVLAYSTSSPTSPMTPPKPFRFKTSTINLTIPLQLGNFFPDSKFVSDMKNSDTYRSFARLFHRIRAWSRRTIWGDRLFLQFTGPATLLIQSRASRVSDVLSAREVSEIADAPPGVVQKVVKDEVEKIEASAVGDAARTDVKSALPSTASEAGPSRPAWREPRLNYASVSRDGKVTIEKTDDFSQFKR